MYSLKDFKSLFWHGSASEDEIWQNHKWCLRELWKVLSISVSSCCKIILAHWFHNISLQKYFWTLLWVVSGYLLKVDGFLKSVCIAGQKINDRYIGSLLFIPVSIGKCVLSRKTCHANFLSCEANGLKIYPLLLTNQQGGKWAFHSRIW